MHQDKSTKVVTNDKLISSFGASLLRNQGSKRANDVAKRMRQLARLMCAASEIQPSKESMVLKPK
jgi:hypothetical protein